MAASIGQPIKRKEDKRFLLGKGRYTDDVTFPDQAYAYVLRSPHAHAEIKSVDVAKASAMPGVVAIFTGADVAADQLGGLPCGWGVTDRNGQPMAEPPHPLLVTDRARHVGDNVALVIADSLGEARDAVEAITVDYAPMPAVSSASTALGKKAPLVHDDIAGNLCYDWEIGDAKAVDQAFAAAAKTALVDVVNNRVVPNAMEPRAANAIYDVAADSYTLYMTSQNPHVIRLLMGCLCSTDSGTQATDHRARCRRWLRLQDLSLCRRGAGDLGFEESWPSGQVVR